MFLIQKINFALFFVLTNKLYKCKHLNIIMPKYQLITLNQYL